MYCLLRHKINPENKEKNETQIYTSNTFICIYSIFNIMIISVLATQLFAKYILMVIKIDRIFCIHTKTK